MATFNELVQMVYDVTGRPDKVAETKLAIKAATLKAHQSDTYFKDRFETGIQFETADYYQSLNLRALFPRYRSLDYFRRYDMTGSGAPGEFFDLIEPQEVLDSYSTERSNIVYGAGSGINIKAATPIKYALVGIRLNPDVNENTFESWVAIEYPFYIVYEAARVLFKQIGYDEQSAAMDKLAGEQLTLLKQNNIVLGG